MARKQTLPDLKRWLIPKLRNASRIWPAKKDARNKAKVKVQEGYYKNGNPIWRTKYECASCKGNFEREETQMDHIAPVIALDGFDTWDIYILSLFVGPDGYQCLCKVCHNNKTQDENKQRKKHTKKT
jgi:5-methylcytosine-specific restriction endonuclease McrA